MTDRTAPAKEARSEPLVTDERLAEFTDGVVALSTISIAEIESVARELQSRRSSPVREGDGKNQERILPTELDAVQNKKEDGIVSLLRLYGPRSTIPELVRRAAAEIERVTADKDAAYLERNKVVAALASLFPSGIARTDIPGWLPEWHGCVYIDLPTGQVSWHYHDNHAGLFSHLPAYRAAWDGHDTDEKYRRLFALSQDAHSVLGDGAKGLDDGRGTGESGAEGNQASPSLSPSEPSGRGESGGHTPDDRSLSMNKEEQK